MRLAKRLTKLALLLLLFLVVMAGVYRRELRRVVQVLRLFEPSVVVENFRSMDGVFQTAHVGRSQAVHEFDRSLVRLPESYEYRGEVKSLEEFLGETWTTGLIVLLDGRMAFERYYRGNSHQSKVISWSVAKSLVSALVGIAIEEGQIKNVLEPITDYVPMLRETGYDGVSLKDVLQMSSGIGFDENYGDFFSDINRMGRAMALGSSIEGFVASLRREREPGTYNHYVSMDTQVLAMVLRRATGENLSSYLESRIWQRIGTESDAYWLVDSDGVALAFGGFNAVLRDYARFGQLYLQEGEWNGERIVSEDWVRRSVTPDAPHLQPGENPASSWVLGYGYQWWIPQQAEGDYLAIGIYNQFIYIHPKYRVVIAKSSAYPDYNVDGDEKELETIQVFRTITRKLG